MTANKRMESDLPKRASPASSAAHAQRQGSMFDIMRFYVFRPGWRVRLAWNDAASWIWTLWVLAALFAFGALGTLVKGDVGTSVACFGIAGLLFVGSYLFLPEARRIHRIDLIIHRHD